MENSKKKKHVSFKTSKSKTSGNESPHVKTWLHIWACLMDNLVCTNTSFDKKVISTFAYENKQTKNKESSLWFVCSMPACVCVTSCSLTVWGFKKGPVRQSWPEETCKRHGTEAAARETRPQGHLLGWVQTGHESKISLSFNNLIKVQIPLGVRTRGVFAEVRVIFEEQKI